MWPGNIFAVRPGKKDGPPTYAGSHMDTQVQSFSHELKKVIDSVSQRVDDTTESWASMQASKP